MISLNRVAFDREPGEPKYPLELSRSSWSQIWEVLSWAGVREPMSEVQERYFEQTGRHYSKGNFWAAIQELQRQFDKFEALRNLAERIDKDGVLPPITGDHPSFGDRCPLCGKPFQAGDLTTFLEIEPTNEAEAEKKREGRPYNAACDIVHKDCRERAAKAVRFVEHVGEACSRDGEGQS